MKNQARQVHLGGSGGVPHVLDLYKYVCVCWWWLLFSYPVVCTYLLVQVPFFFIIQTTYTYRHIYKIH